MSDDQKPLFELPPEERPGDERVSAEERIDMFMKCLGKALKEMIREEVERMSGGTR